ncbi:MAG: hypothetical protein C0473_04160 [Cyanobacteria bacterium DS3.002]|nr:hypothetical protein [Cyanobacteria bacterium DS3.002]MBA4050134.1 hypothetical protein [Cyanobacteria bacterium DS2.008]MBA4077023.1 hypothetical protein [Cyanobacteria bacterium PR.023]
MTFKWASYISLAETLITDPVCDSNSPPSDKQQAIYRAALSRAYYGLFNCACNYLRDVEKDEVFQLQLRKNEGQTLTFAEENQLKLAQAAIHTYVSNQLAIDARDGQRNRLRKALRKGLSELKERRIEADYRETATFRYNSVKSAIGDAQAAVGNIMQLSRQR